jgi:hypothetical protein
MKSRKIDKKWSGYVCCDCGGKIINISPDSTFASAYSKIMKQCWTCSDAKPIEKRTSLSGDGAPALNSESDSGELVVCAA